jgi:hypothetical protein
MNRATRTVPAVLTASAAPLCVLLAWQGWRDQLPDPLPTHWNLSGRVDDTMPPAVLFAAAVALSTVLAAAAVVTLVRSRQQPADRLMVTALVWAAWLATTVFVVPAALARGAATAEAVSLSLLAVAAIPAVPSLAALVVWLAQATEPQAPTAPAPASSIRLSEGERVAWVGRSASPRLLLVAGGLVVVAVFLVFTAWPVANLVGLVALTVFWSHVISVRVDNRAVTVAWGPARWPRLVVPIEDVESARSEHIEPLRWGGWGFRRTPHGAAAVTRRGPGLVLERRGKVPLAVTVDSPEPAADLVNALVERHHRTVTR